jgi:hypothetical protein
MIEGLARFHVLPADLSDTEVGQPDCGRHCEDQGGDGAGDLAQAEEDGRRDQVDERRHRLHEVEDRPGDGLDRVAAGHGDTQRQSDGQGHKARADHQGQGRDRLGPDVHAEQQRHGCQREEAEAPADPPPGDGHDQAGEHQRRDREQGVLEGADDQPETVGDPVEDPGEVVLHPVDTGLDPVADRDPETQNLFRHAQAALSRVCSRIFLSITPR